MIKDDYTHLKSLLAGSFYQCWFEHDDRSPNEILLEAIDNLDVNAIQGVIEEVDYLLLNVKLEADLEEVLAYKAGCNYSPSDDGLTYHSWLFELKKMLACKSQ